VKIFDAGKTRMIGLPYGEKTMTGSRSLKMALFDRPYATFYWSAIVNIALSCTIFELFEITRKLYKIELYLQ